MYQANVSHLHKPGGGTTVISNRGTRPPLPATKPPQRTTPIPTKNMQNLDNSVVSKFMQVVSQEKPQNGTGSGDKFTSEYTLQPQQPQASHLWKQPTDKLSNGTSKPTPWATKSTKEEVPAWVKKAEVAKASWNGSQEAPKPTWTAKSLEKPKAVWSPKSADTSDGVAKTWNGGQKEVTRRLSKEDPAPVNGHSKEGVRRQLSRDDGLTVVNGQNRASYAGADWRSKYEESERKRKELLEENQKAALDKSNLERRANKLENELYRLQEEHQKKSQQLDQLSQVSQKVYQDYDKLNNKYEVETNAMHRALQVASKWYLQNKKLRRESIARAPHEISPLDETDGDDNEVEDLRKTVQDLSTQVGQLQSELNSAKLQEFEVQEQQVTLQQQLDDERHKTQQLSKQVKELQLMRDKFESVTVMVQGEVDSLRQQKDAALDQVKRLQGETHEAKRERNVLQHQSLLLMGDITPEDRLFNVLLEVEDLKRKLEESEHRHEMEMQEMQERLEEKQSDSYIELLEGKLRLLESELQMALERAEQAESSLKQLEKEGKPASSSMSSGPPCPPPPPPPPPLPPMLGTNPPLKKPIQRRPTEGDSLEDMARLLGIERTPKPPGPQVVAIDNIINEIKGGKFTLKATEKVTVKKEEQPAAVQEMLSIIGTLKRRPRSKASVNV